METNIELKKAKINSDNHLQVEYTEITASAEDPNESVYTEITKKCGQKVHKDLITAYSRFIPHLLLLCELIDSPDIDGLSWDPGDSNSIFDMPVLEKFTVTSFSIGGSDEHEGITITGKKFLKSGKVLNLNTPFTKFEDENMPYTYAKELHAAFIDVDYEVQAYIEGKYAPPSQLNLFNSNTAVDEEGKLTSMKISS